MIDIKHEDQYDLRSNNVYSGEHSDLRRRQLEVIQPDPIVDEDSGDEYVDNVQGEEDLYLMDGLPTLLEKGGEIKLKFVKRKTDSEKFRRKYD